MVIFRALDGRRSVSEDTLHQIFDECEAEHTTESGVIYKAKSIHSHLATCLDLGLSFFEPQYQRHRRIVNESYVIKSPLRYADFITEQNMLEACNRRYHPHIIPLIASFHFEGSGYLIMPAAVMDLGELFTRPAQSETVEWLISQLAGLADALRIVHGHLQSAEGKNLFGLHGDIKAGNVLVFKHIDNPTVPPVLQLADFGSSKLFDGPEKVFNIHGVDGSGTHAAPECVLERPYSQAADIWSFSCLMLEFLIWFKQGPPGLQSFAESRMHKSSPYGMEVTADYFFKLEPARKEDGDQTCYVRTINPAVTARIDELRSLEECNGNIPYVLDLLEQHLLVINPARRMLATELVLNLQCLVDDSSNNKSEEKVESCRKGVDVCA